MARPGPTGPPPSPIVQRLSIRYAKRGRMRFASHRDVARAIERGVRRAGVPVAYSAGFSPHPRISYAGGAPTGSASEAEYLEIALTRRCEPAEVGRLLNAALPDGMDVVEVVEVDGRSPGPSLEASAWEVTWPGVAPDAAAGAIAAFLARQSVPVERLTAKGTRQLDARAAVISLSLANGGARPAGQQDAGRGDGSATAGGRAGAGTDAGCAILRIVIRQMTPAVRPDDVLTALSRSSQSQGSDLVPVAPALATRLWQGPLSGLAADQTGMIVDSEAAVAGALSPATAAPVTFAPAARTAAPGHDTDRSRPEEVGPDQHGPEPWTAERGPGCMTDNAPRPRAESAGPAPAGRPRANGQLPRGARVQLADPRAREPYGRDCPDARDRAAEPAARSEPAVRSE